jgi:putative oxygen-independent coproporphyrinogen III oxidase
LKPIELAHLSRAGLLQLKALPPLSLYVHLPWCVQKCPYCDFNSHGLNASSGRPAQLLESEQDLYLQAVMADLVAALPLIWGRSVHTVFIGGGTPSLFEPQRIEQLISQVRALVPLAPGCEITMEANPGTFETERFKAFAQAGVTRLSIGVQSFHDEHLQALGRIHNAEQAMKAVTEAASTFKTFNIDLMYALPAQSLQDLQRDLETALSFSPPHLSIYQLTLEPNTRFAKYPPRDLPSEDTAYEMLDVITQITNTQGLNRYEVSAFAKDGHACAHNLNYWQFGDYLGIGAGAHSKLSFAHRIVRQIRVREPQLYMQKAKEDECLAQHEEIRHSDLAFEFMLNALRLKEGFPIDLFVERTGLSPSRIEPALNEGLKKGLLERKEGWIMPSEKGFDFLNDLQSLFLAD